jgi:hypothetical protein
MDDLRPEESASATRELRSLRRQLAVTQSVGGLALTVLAVLWFSSAFPRATSPGDTAGSTHEGGPAPLKTSGIILTDARRQPRAVLGIGADEQPMLMFVGKGGASLAIGVDEATDAPQIRMVDTGGKIRFLLRLDTRPDGSTSLLMADPSAYPRFSIRQGRASTSMIMASDREHDPASTQLVVGSRGDSIYRILNQSGDVQLRLPEEGVK